MEKHPVTLSEASRRVLSLLKESGPSTSTGVGQLLSISSEAARQQLVRLEIDGLVHGQAQRTEKGRGRPQQLWTLSQAGHGLFPDRHAEITVQLIDTIRQAFGENGIDQVIAGHEVRARARYAAAMQEVSTLPERLDRLVTIRSHEGYMAEWHAVEDGYILVENHCPICAAAMACQGFCRAEQALFEEMLGPDVIVERFDHVLKGDRRCAYQIRSRR